MKVKRFLAQDMRRALVRIREEMGEDAVILSNRSLDGGVEVVAASLPEHMLPAAAESVDRLAAERQAAAAASGTTRTSVSSQNSVGADKGVAAFEFGRLQREAQQNMDTPYLKATKDQQIRLNSAKQQAEKSEAAAQQARLLQDQQHQQEEQQRAASESREMNKMRSELNGIRRLLEQRLSGIAWDQFARRSPIQATVWERLNAMGVPAALSRTLLESVKPEHTAAEAWRFAIATLSRAVPVAGTDLAAQGGIYALLGPTGVGKTTTIGKLATRHVLEHGSESLALVTTDSFRVAAHEQLRTFGRILGVTVRVVDDGHSLRQVLDSLRHKSLILIDTAGLHPGNAGLQSQLQALKSCPEVHKLLVLACTSQAGVLATACNTYAPAGLNGCILSKLDEAGTMGEVLAQVIDRHLPVAYETHGQNIPDDIRVAQAHSLVSKAVALSIHNEDEKERLIYEFGDVWGGAKEDASVGTGTADLSGAESRSADGLIRFGQGAI
ncbi:MAG: flagellar biosynthesis protein FlhF [Gammaproteobacteria bacterium]|nr:flagellar biosynthesis protein FlhF [Gammaproteobacteria bacterium]MDP2140854.1 flagellar biosynthesis protein FlhF [Gammaproteobacteria bacterium]MDP2349403.1 flagellar biosynthesis protein FlhF [Gammaproteobacteria bacterium]